MDIGDYSTLLVNLTLFLMQNMTVSLLKIKKRTLLHLTNDYSCYQCFRCMIYGSIGLTRLLKIKERLKISSH